MGTSLSSYIQVPLPGATGHLGKMVDLPGISKDDSLVLNLGKEVK